MSVPLSQCKDKATILLIVSYVVIIDQGEKLHFWLRPPLSPSPMYQIASWFSLPLGHIPQAAHIQFIQNWIYHLFPKPDLPPLLFSIPMQPRQEPRRFPQMLFHSLRWRSHRFLPPQLLSVGVLLFIPSAIFISPLNPCTSLLAYVPPSPHLVSHQQIPCPRTRRMLLKCKFDHATPQKRALRWRARSPQETNQVSQHDRKAFHGPVISSSTAQHWPYHTSIQWSQPEQLALHAPCYFTLFGLLRVVPSAWNLLPPFNKPQFKTPFLQELFPDFLPSLLLLSP